MPRRRKTQDDDVSLFPFLSIIACVIGVLTMLISTLALAQMDGEDVARIEQWERTQQSLAEQNQQIQQLTQQLGPESAQIQRDLSQRQQELEQLQLRQQQLQQELKQQKQIEVTIPTIDESLRETAASMQAELERLQNKVAQLERDLQDREQKAAGTTTILPAGSGLSLTPHFVECAQGSVVLHTEDPPRMLRAAHIVTDAGFIDLLTTVANGSDDSLIFLIRPDGLATWRAAKALCDERGIRNGKLPVTGSGRIDLSRFQQAVQESP